MLLSSIVRYTGSMDEQGDFAPPYQYTNPPPEPITPEQDTAGQERDLSQYSLTVEAASDLFIKAGVPRSPRSVIRFCSNSALDCIKVDTERNMKYLVTPVSVQVRIAELQQIASAGRDSTRLDMTRHDESRHDTTRHDAPSDENKKVSELTSRVGELERQNEELVAKNRDLEITNRVKDALLTRNEGMLATLQGQVMKFNRAVGELATILRLKAPEEDTSRIIAYLDAPSQATDHERENLVDASN
jgi:hypothetical protein